MKKTLDPAKIKVYQQGDRYMIGYEGEGRDFIPEGVRQQLHNIHSRNYFLNNKVALLKECICEALNIKLK